MMRLLLGGCVRGEAAPVPLIRTAASRCWVCALIIKLFFDWDKEVARLTNLGQGSRQTDEVFPTFHPGFL